MKSSTSFSPENTSTVNQQPPANVADSQENQAQSAESKAGTIKHESSSETVEKPATSDAETAAVTLQPAPSRPWRDPDTLSPECIDSLEEECVGTEVWCDRDYYQSSDEFYAYADAAACKQSRTKRPTTAPGPADMHPEEPNITTDISKPESKTNDPTPAMTQAQDSELATATGDSSSSEAQKPEWKEPNTDCTGNTAAALESCYGTQIWCRLKAYQQTMETFDNVVACMQSRKNHPAYIDDLLVWKEPGQDFPGCFAESANDPQRLEACVGTEAFCERKYYENFDEVFDNAEACRKSRKRRPGLAEGQNKPASVETQNPSTEEHESHSEEDVSSPDNDEEQIPSSNKSTVSDQEKAEDSFTDEKETPSEQQVPSSKDNRGSSVDGQDPPTEKQDPLADDSNEASMEGHDRPVDENKETTGEEQSHSPNEKGKPFTEGPGNPVDENKEASTGEQSNPSDESKGASTKGQGHPADTDGETSTKSQDPPAEKQDPLVNNDNEASEEKGNPVDDNKEVSSAEEQSHPPNEDKDASKEEQGHPSDDQEESSAERKDPTADGDDDSETEEQGPQVDRKKWRLPRLDSPSCSGLLGHALRFDEKCVGTELWCDQAFYNLTSDKFADAKECKKSRGLKMPSYVGAWKEAKNSPEDCFFGAEMFTEDCVGTEIWCSRDSYTPESLQENYTSPEECKELRYNRPIDEEVIATLATNMSSIVDGTHSDIIPSNATYVCWIQGKAGDSLFCDWQLPSDCEYGAGCSRVEDLPDFCDNNKGCGSCFIGKTTKNFVCYMPQANELTEMGRGVCRQTCLISAENALNGTVQDYHEALVEKACELYC